MTGVSRGLLVYVSADTDPSQAAAGIGKEVALALAEAGTEAVVLADIHEKGAQEAAEESKKSAKHPDYRAMPLRMDIADEASVQNMVDTTIERFGRIDYSVNSAGISLPDSTTSARGFI